MPCGSQAVKTRPDLPHNQLATALLQRPSAQQPPPHRTAHQSPRHHGPLSSPPEPLSPPRPRAASPYHLFTHLVQPLDLRQEPPLARRRPTTRWAASARRLPPSPPGPPTSALSWYPGDGWCSARPHAPSRPPPHNGLAFNPAVWGGSAAAAAGSNDVAVAAAGHVLSMSSVMSWGW